MMNSTDHYSSALNKAANLRGIWRTAEPLAQYTSWRVGGKAKLYYRPADAEDLSNFLTKLPGTEPVLFLGLGSNVLLRDDGFPGTVIHMYKCLDQINKVRVISAESKQLISIGAGVTCAKIAKFCAQHNLLGGEFFAGIPGTMGGALAMNAGAFGSETWDHVVAVDVIDRSGKIYQLPARNFKVGYRSVAQAAITTESDRAQPIWFVAGYLQLAFGDSAVSQQRIKELLHKRNNSQPIGQLSCGSVFKNPPNDYAARLIEAAGLKGIKVGSAVVSTKHANFIINEGNASAKDIETLIYLVQDQVQAASGIRLEPEVKIIGG